VNVAQRPNEGLDAEPWTPQPRDAIYLQRTDGNDHGGDERGNRYPAPTHTSGGDVDVACDKGEVIVTGS
jgi:hypothetical protein